MIRALIAFLRALSRTWSPGWAGMARASQSHAAASTHRARYDLFRALGHGHTEALRRAGGDPAP